MKTFIVKSLVSKCTVECNYILQAFSKRLQILVVLFTKHCKKKYFHCVEEDLNSKMLLENSEKAFSGRSSIATKTTHACR